ncbi:MAG: S8 family serine peptidase, partial [Hyphomicrobiaceae bacterium]|nr:S8 family serine peptidase [Hyphomicrobiaceae bacterium]
KSTSASEQRNDGKKSSTVAKSEKQDDDDDDATPASSGKKTNSSDRTEKSAQSANKKAIKDPDDDKVPETVVEWFQKLTKSTSSTESEATDKVSAKSAQSNAQPSKEAATKESSTKTAQQTQQAKSQSTQNATTKAPQVQRGKPVDLPAMPFARPEMLASRLSPSALAHAQKLGFTKVGVVSMSSAGISATRLSAPEGLTAAAARDMLQRLAPDGTFADNVKYRIYRTATGVTAPGQEKPKQDRSGQEKSGQDKSGVEKAISSRPMATPCGTDRCYGGSIIKWTMQHQSCAAALRVGIIDTGFDATHPSLRLQRIQSNSSQRSAATQAPNWHGTGVVGLLAGDPQSATPGLIPGARFLVSDIFFADADGQPASDTASLIQALDWLDKRGAQIINMSLSGPHDDLLKQAISALSRKGIMFVAAAGNDGPTAPPSYPAAYDTVIAVTAVNTELRNYRHASRGDHIDLAAPGVDIWSALPGERAGYHSGTSFAVPYVTAVLASMYRSLPGKTKQEFLRQVSTTDLGPPGRDPIYGQGLVLAPTSCSTPVTPVAQARPSVAATPVAKASKPEAPIATASSPPASSSTPLSATRSATTSPASVSPSSLSLQPQSAR